MHTPEFDCTVGRSASAFSAQTQEIEEVTPCPTRPTRQQTESSRALRNLQRPPSPCSPAAACPPVHAPQPIEPQAASTGPVEASLARLKNQLGADNRRPVAPHLAAELVNALRPMKPPGAATDRGRAATHGDLVGRIGPQDVMRWYEAQGLGEKEVAHLRRAALLSGMPNPLGSAINNAMQYVVSPWLCHAAGNPWASAGFGFATAAIAAPMNAAQQSAVVALCESVREHGGPTIVPDKQQINDKHWLPDLARSLEVHLSEFSHCCTEFRTLQSAAENDPSEAAHIRRTTAAGQLLEAEARLLQAQRNFVMTQGAHDRQWKGNRWQSIPRTLRSPLAGTLGLLSKTGTVVPVSPAAQTAGALLMTAAQHVAAGFDEQAKQDANNLLNLLYADILAPSGREKLARGEPVEAQDILTGKLRGLIQSPTQALVKRATAELVSMEKLLAADVAASPSPQGAADADDLDLELGHGAGPARALHVLRQDLQALRDGRLDELAPDGVATALLLGAETSVLSDQLMRDVAKKYTSREFSAQTAQRIGQMFHLGVLGSAASSVLCKATSAAQGGTRAVPIPQTVAISALSGAMAAVGALNQHTAITVKNNRREGDTDIGLGQQIIRGMKGGATEVLAQRRATHASKAINKLLESGEARRLLNEAELLTQGAAASSSTRTPPTLALAEAAEQLRPGGAAFQPSPHVVVEMDDLRPPRSSATLQSLFLLPQSP